MNFQNNLHTLWSFISHRRVSDGAFGANPLRVCFLKIKGSAPTSFSISPSQHTLQNGKILQKSVNCCWHFPFCPNAAPWLLFPSQLQAAAPFPVISCK